MDKDALAELGLTPEDYKQERDSGVFPDNMLSAEVFGAMGTQWRMSPAGMMGTPIPLGLDYAAVEAVMRMMAVPAEKAGQVFSDVRYMESVALQFMRDQ